MNMDDHYLAAPDRYQRQPYRAAGRHGLRLPGIGLGLWHNFGADYDTTLMAWYERFLASWPEIADNYSERFKRMFTYYLNACAGAFRARDIQLWQVVFSRGIEHGLRVAR